MKLIATKKSKNDKCDTVRCVRRDGSETSTTMPRQGVLPHDLIHYVVESALEYEHGFLGLIAKGADIGFAMEQTHDSGNQALADQALHAEAIVESLQAQIWSGTFDLAMFHAGVEAACSMRSIPAPDLGQTDPEEELYGAIMQLSQRWQSVPFHGSMELEMSHL